MKLKPMDKEPEIWKSIDGYDGIYEISSYGRVRSADSYRLGVKKSKRFISGRILSPGNVFGYRQVHLTKLGNSSPKRVHILVAQAFIANPENKPKVNHLDGDKANNHIDNLEWSTQLENIHHSLYILGKTHYGTNHHSAKLTEEIVRKAKEMHRDNPEMKIKDIANTFGIFVSNIRGILSGKNWPHVKI